MLTSTLQERLQTIQNYFKFKSKNEMADTLGIDRTRMTNFANNRCKNLQVDETIRFKTILKIDPWWLISGEGKMLLSETKTVETVYTENEFKVKLVYPSEGKEYITVDKALLPDFVKNASNLRMLKIKGDSMSPTINDGDMAFIYIGETIKNSGLYASIHGDNAVITRITLMTDNLVQISYDNPSYPSHSVNKNNLEILGKVVLLVTHK